MIKKVALRVLGISMLGAVCGLVEIGSFDLLAVESCASVVAGVGRKAGQSSGELNSATSLHAFFYSEEIRTLAQSLGIYLPEMSGRDGPKFGQMDMNTRFMDSYLDFILRLQKRPDVLARYVRCIRVIETAYDVESKRIWRRELRDAVDRWERDPNWAKGHVDLDWRFVRSPGNGGPSSEKIFQRVLLANSFEEISRQRLLPEKSSADDARVSSSLGSEDVSAFVRMLGRQHREVLRVQRELDALPHTKIFDRASVDRAIAIMKSLSEFSNWAVGEWGDGNALDPFEQRQLIVFVDDQLRFPTRAAVIDRLKTFTPLGDYRAKEIEEVRATWLAILYDLDQIPAPSRGK